MAETLLRIATGFWSSKALHAVAELGVADAIHKHGGPATAEEIAAAIPDVDARFLFRVLRHVASLGIFDMQLDGSPDDVAYHKTFRFGLNETSQLMRSDVERSMRSSIQLEAGHFHYGVWAGFLECLKTGKGVVNSTFGVDTVWEYNEKNPHQRKIFNAAMTNFTLSEIDQVLASYDFAGITSIVDIGGGLGSLLFSILRKYPEIKKGHLYDLPSVVKDTVVPDDLKDRVEVHGGSFLDDSTGIPSGADAYIMKHIIHDWDDESSEVILKATRKAMPDHAKVLLVEYTVPTGPEPCLAKALDLHMMALAGAKERTKEEYAVLFRAAGLELTQVAGPHAVNVIEARPAQ
jgi:hypothetical protein